MAVSRLDFELRPDQWHLNNTGQAGIAGGIDINVLPVWLDYTGKGIEVLVFDTGLDTNHPDLLSNFLADKAYNYHTATTDPSYLTLASPHWHGTFVAGLIAANNGPNGLRGVAYDAKFSSYADFNGPNAKQAFAHAADAGFDVINNSWGTDLAFVSIFYQEPNTLASMTHAVEHGRGGLGLNIVVSAGNSYAYMKLYDSIGYEWSGEFPMADANTSSVSNSRFRSLSVRWMPTEPMRLGRMPSALPRPALRF